MLVAASRNSFKRKMGFGVLHMVNRRAVLQTGGALGLACLMPTALATPLVSPPRLVAFLDVDTPGAHASFGRLVAAMDQRRLREKYGLEGRFVALDQNSTEALRGLPRQLDDLQPWMVIATSLPTAKAVQATGRAGLFYSPVNPVALGLVESFHRPGGRMTGYAGQVASIDKMSEVLRDALPAARRVRVIVDHLFAEYAGGGDAIRRAVVSQGLAADLVIAETWKEFEDGVSAGGDRPDAWLLPYTVIPFQYAERVADRLKLVRAPALHGSARVVRAGGLMSLEPDIADVTDVFARQLELMAQGSAIAEIPVEGPRVFRLTVNLAAASNLGLRFPATFVKRVDSFVG